MKTIPCQVCNELASTFTEGVGELEYVIQCDHCGNVDFSSTQIGVIRTWYENSDIPMPIAVYQQKKLGET